MTVYKLRGHYLVVNFNFTNGKLQNFNFILKCTRAAKRNSGRELLGDFTGVQLRKRLRTTDESKLTTNVFLDIQGYKKVFS